MKNFEKDVLNLQNDNKNTEYKLFVCLIKILMKQPRTIIIWDIKLIINKTETLKLVKGQYNILFKINIVHSKCRIAGNIKYKIIISIVKL